MPNHQNDPLNLVAPITHRFVKACLHIVMENKLSNGKYRSVQKLAQSIGMSQVTFFYLKSDSAGRSVTVSALAHVIALHNVSAAWLFTGNGNMFNDTQEAQVTELAKIVAKLQKQVAKK